MTSEAIEMPMTDSDNGGRLAVMGEIFDWLSDNPIAGVIVACEVGFWLVLAAGLAARYLLRWPRTGVVLLACTPLVDVVLLVATVFDLRGGAEATTVHGISAAYLGFSVAFGHSMIRWADRQVAYRFGNGERPAAPPKHGPERLRREWREWRKCVLACGVAAAVIGVLVLVSGSPERTEALWGATGWLPRLGLVAGIWLVTGPLWSIGARSTGHRPGRP
jgi:hypothetical protein